MARFSVLTATIAQSATVSDTVEVAGYTPSALWCPVVTSCALFVQAATSTTSAEFVRLQNPAGSGDWTLAVGVGSKAFTREVPGFSFPYLRLETSVAQAAARTFLIPVKL